MIFADKLIELRKKSGWSQEELAHQMHVTRQSVSKWEGAQSVPDLTKMIQLSDLFGVSLDYLLKDEVEMPECDKIAEEPQADRKRVSMEEACRFLEVKEMTAKWIAYATFLCIISPVALIILGIVSESPVYGIKENTAGGIGMIILLLLIAVAAVIYILSGSKTEPFAYLEKEIFETEYGVTGMVKEKREQYRSTYTRNNMIGTSMCILSLLPLFGGIIISENDVFIGAMISTMLVLVGIGVTCFIRVGIVWESFRKLLQEGEYSRKKKEQQPVIAVIVTTYWLIVTAIYLGYSLITGKWGESWTIWPIAGILYAVLSSILNVYTKVNERKDFR